MAITLKTAGVPASQVLNTSATGLNISIRKADRNLTSNWMDR